MSVETTSPSGEASVTYGAQAVIITLPVGVLQASPGEVGALRFEPGVQKKREAALRLAMGAVVKIILRFDQPFWEELKTARGESLEQLAFFHGRSMPFATWWNFYPVRAPFLVGWAGGPSTDTLIGKSDADITSAAVKSLSHFTNVEESRISSMIQRAWVCDWQQDPFARGAYSYVPVGAVDAVRELAEPVEATLFFAGEATDYDSFGGTVDSALRTGERAAGEVLQLASRGAPH